MNLFCKYSDKNPKSFTSKSITSSKLLFHLEEIDFFEFSAIEAEALEEKEFLQVKRRPFEYDYIILLTRKPSFGTILLTIKFRLPPMVFNLISSLDWNKLLFQFLESIPNFIVLSIFPS
jgi:hypothetical protein